MILLYSTIVAGTAMDFMADIIIFVLVKIGIHLLFNEKEWGLP